MKKTSSNKNGSTLVECIVAFALFSIATFILLSGFLTAGNLVVRSSDIKNYSDNITNVIETDNAQSGVSLNSTSVNNITFTLGKVIYTSKGSYKTASVDNMKLVEFIPDISTTNNNFIPDTNVPVNGEWPTPPDYPDQWTWITIPKGTTFVDNGVYYVAANDLSVGPRGATPTSGWWYNNNSGLITISSRPVIVWNGGTITDFYNFTGGKMDFGDKVLWNGNYYVFTIHNQTWADPPNISTRNWIMLK